EQPESNGTPYHFTSDPAHPDDAKHLVVELDAFEIFAVPFTAAHDCIGLRNFPRDAKQQGKCMFGGRNGVAARRVEHNNTASRRSFDIDIINTDAGTANHAHLGAGIQDITANFGLTIDNTL